MNGPQTPAFVKDNAMTRLINRVSEINASEGKPAGRAMTQAAETFQPAIPAHKLRGLSEAQQRRLDYVPDMMSPEETMRANARAAALGLDDEMMPMSPGMNIGRPIPPAPPDDPGGPTEEEIEAMLPSRFRSGPAPTAAPGPVTDGGMLDPRLAARAAVPSGRPMVAADAHGMFAARTMPNFRNIQGFNLERGVAVVDGIEFPLADDDVRDMKKFALHVVLDSMVIQVAQALVDIGVPPEMAEKAAQTLRDTAAEAAVPGSMANGAGREAVREVQSEPTADGVQQEPAEEGRAPVGVPDVPVGTGEGEDSFWLLADGGEEDAGSDVQADGAGGS